MISLSKFMKSEPCRCSMDPQTLNLGPSDLRSDPLRTPAGGPRIQFFEKNQKWKKGQNWSGFSWIIFENPCQNIFPYGGSKELSTRLGFRKNRVFFTFSKTYSIPHLKSIWKYFTPKIGCIQSPWILPFLEKNQSFFEKKRTYSIAHLNRLFFPKNHEFSRVFKKWRKKSPLLDGPPQRESWGTQI